MYASMDGQLDVVRTLLEAGADVHAKTNVRNRDGGNHDDHVMMLMVISH